MSNEASLKAFEAWHSQRAAEIISKGEAIAQEMIKAGCTDSGSTHCSALLTALDQADGTGRDAWNAGRKALEAEQAQMEPFAWVVLDYDGVPIYCAPAKQMCNDHINEAISEYCIAEAGGWVIRDAFTHQVPPPAEPTVKQPLSTERADLTQWVREFADMEFSQHSTESKRLRKSADMLEADGVAHTSLSALASNTETMSIANGMLHKLRAENKALKAQQVAVPMTDEQIRPHIQKICRHHGILNGVLEADLSCKFEELVCQSKQQVAVPADALTVLKEMIAMMDSGDEHGEGSEWHLKARAAVASSIAKPAAVPAGFALVPIEPTDACSFCFSIGCSGECSGDGAMGD